MKVSSRTHFGFYLLLPSVHGGLVRQAQAASVDTRDDSGLGLCQGKRDDALRQGEERECRLGGVEDVFVCMFHPFPACDELGLYVVQKRETVEVACCKDDGVDALFCRAVCELDGPALGQELLYRRYVASSRVVGAGYAVGGAEERFRACGPEEWADAVGGDLLAYVCSRGGVAYYDHFLVGKVFCASVVFRMAYPAGVLRGPFCDAGDGGNVRHDEVSVCYDDGVVSFCGFLCGEEVA